MCVYNKAMVRSSHALGAICALIMLALCLMPSAAWSNVKIYTSNRMSNNLVACMAQDSVGQVWIGTWYGLNKFDGYRFSIYTHRSDDAHTVPSNTIVALHTDRSGKLWVGTARGLAHYDERRDAFCRVGMEIESGD